MAAPSTAWQERIGPDEAARHERYAEQFVRFQRSKSAAYGNGRALHRKQHLALRARLDVLSDLPAYARAGLFATPGGYDALIRLSSASMNVHPDKVPDIRGFALKVYDVHGPGALGGETSEQDFVMINLPTFRLPSSAPFAGLVVARAKSDAAVLRFLLRTYGPFRFVRQARRGLESVRWPFTGFMTEPFHSAAPIACGDHAVRVRIRPRDLASVDPEARNDWAADVRRRLASAPVVFDMQLQFFTDEQTTPIEDASVDWPQDASPFVSVATLTIRQQETEDGAAAALAREVEAMSFDPWHALAAQRPLGEVMRARKVVYYESVKARSTAAS